MAALTYGGMKFTATTRPYLKKTDAAARGAVDGKEQHHGIRQDRLRPRREGDVLRDPADDPRRLEDAQQHLSEGHRR